MPVYHYKAATIEGEIVEGVLNSPNERQASETLKDSRLIPIKISVSAGAKKVLKPMKSARTGLLSFTTELTALLDAGLPLDRSLIILSETSHNSAMKGIIISIMNSISEGLSFSEALQKHPKVFPRLYVNIVKAGEVGGVLETVMGKLTEFLESSDELKNHIYSAMIYPVILAVSGGLSVIVLLTFVIPKFSTIFDDLGQTIPLSTQILLNISGILSSYWWLILILLVLAVFAFNWFINNEKGMVWWDSFKLKILGDIVTKLETTRFCRTLGTLTKSGVPLLQALKNVQEVVGNSIIRDSINKVIKGAKEGQGISGPITASGVFPPLAVSMIKVGEETGRLDVMLLKIAETYEKDLKTTIKRFINLLEPAMILIMAVVVGFIVMSMFFAIFSINELPF